MAVTPFQERAAALASPLPTGNTTNLAAANGRGVFGEDLTLDGFALPPELPAGQAAATADVAAAAPASQLRSTQSLQRQQQQASQQQQQQPSGGMQQWYAAAQQQQPQEHQYSQQYSQQQQQELSQKLMQQQLYPQQYSQQYSQQYAAPMGTPSQPLFQAASQQQQQLSFQLPMQQPMQQQWGAPQEMPRPVAPPISFPVSSKVIQIARPLGFRLPIRLAKPPPKLHLPAPPRSLGISCDISASPPPHPAPHFLTQLPLPLLPSSSHSSLPPTPPPRSFCSWSRFVSSTTCGAAPRSSNRCGIVWISLYFPVCPLQLRKCKPCAPCAHLCVCTVVL